MSRNTYILDENWNPILETDTRKWAAWFETAKRSVGDETIGESRISTVFLGLDHNYSGTGAPVLWETMVFGGPLDQEQDRCSGSKEQAQAMHASMVKQVKESGMTTEQIRLAHIEHQRWFDLWKALLSRGAVTEQDLLKAQSAEDTPGCFLLARIRGWAQSLVDVTVEQRVKNMEAWAPTKEQLSSLSNLILRYAKAPDNISTHNIGLPGVIMVQFAELWIGIEPDGYAHS